MPAKKIIHVNQHNIRSNVKSSNKEKPIVTVKFRKKTYYAHSVDIRGSSKIVYPDRQLSCGARVWIETYADVILTDINGKTIEVLLD